MKTCEAAFNDYNELLNNFDGVDIKYSDEFEDEDFETLNYQANILNLDKYSDFINTITNSEEYTFDNTFDDFIKDTEYGQITINISDDFITILVIANYEDCIDNTEIDESLNPITESGIYPVNLYAGVDEAFLNIINEILGGNITEVNDLELIPALGFGGAGRYWYKANIVLDDDTIINFINNKDTPEAKRLLNTNMLHINPYSDISIDCSANIAQYQDGVTLDAFSESDANMDILDNESNIIGNAIISKLVKAEDRIIDVLKQYEDLDNEDYIDESLIPIKKCNKKLKESNDDSNKDLNTRKVFNHLDNIEYLVSSYQELDKKTLGQLIKQLEDEIDGLNDVYIKMTARIKTYTL